MSLAISFNYSSDEIAKAVDGWRLITLTINIFLDFDKIRDI